MKITLIGYMGAGKTRVGDALAKKMQLPFFDLDAEIEKQTGFSASETLFNKGELFFRKLEKEVLEEILTREKFVLATGGGTPCYYENTETINRNSVSIYLRKSIAELSFSLEGFQKERPLIAHLAGDQLKEFIAKHLFERAVFYERATVIFDTENKAIETLADEISKLIND